MSPLVSRWNVVLHLGVPIIRDELDEEAELAELFVVEDESELRLESEEVEEFEESELAELFV